MNTIIILHGWQSSKERWEKVKQELEKSGLKVLVPDIPGFKPETELKRPWRLDNYIDWFNSFLAEQKIAEPFFLIGHSFGGRMSIKFADRHPEKLKGLVLVSSAGIKNNAMTKRMLKKGAKAMKKMKIQETRLLSGVWQFFRGIFYKYILRKTDYFKTTGNLTPTIKNILDQDLTCLLEKISVKTLIIWGKKDFVTLLKDGLLMNEKIPNSEIEILSGIGHTPHLENPKLLAEKIKLILK